VLVLLQATGLDACVGLGMCQPSGTALVERHPVCVSHPVLAILTSDISIAAHDARE